MRRDYLPYCKPYIDADDVASVGDSMREGWLTSGPKTREFEKQFSTLSRLPHAVAVNSCTSALQLALVALGVGSGDEIVMPAFTFVAGAECAKQLGAEPVFCDVDETTLCVTRSTIEKAVGLRTKVIIPMHYGGQPAEIREIAEFAHSLGIAVVEDAAHAVGTIAHGQWPGFYSDAAAYSFYATKNITTAEGGMLLTNRPDLAERVRILSLHGMDRDSWHRYEKGGAWRYDVVKVGYKCNLPDMAAALGLSQLKKLNALQLIRDRLAARYASGLKAVPGITPVGETPAPPDRHSWCLFAVIVNELETGIGRDDLANRLRESNIGTSVHFIPTHKFSAYQSAKRGDLTVTDRVWQRILSLPLYPGMKEADVDDVVSELESITSSAKSHPRPATSRSAC